MNAGEDASRGSWLVRNRMTAISLVTVIAYAAFIQWIWGWPVLLRQWTEIGLVPVLSALLLLVGTYFIRCYRIYDYFPGETRGRFLTLLRVTQVHNLLNIMLPFRAGETSFPILMRSEFAVPADAQHICAAADAASRPACSFCRRRRRSHHRPR
jgi:hypothetical protein